MDKWGVFLSGCLTNCKGVNRTIFIQLNMRLYCSCILTLVLLCFFLLPPPPSGHLASLTLALAWPTFLGFIHQEKNRTLTGIPLKAHRSQRHWDRQYTVQINTNVASSQTTVNFVTMSTAVTVLWANTSCHTITVSLFIKWCPLSAPDEGAWVIVRSYMTYQFLQK